MPTIAKVLLCIIVIIFAAMPAAPVLAADAETIDGITDPGILPDSGFYFMKQWGRNLQLSFASSNSQRAELKLKFASDRAPVLRIACIV